MISLLVLLFAYQSFALPGVEISPKNHSEKPRLEKLFLRAAQYFESELGKLDGSVRIEIAPSACLRTGYNRRTGSVVFCPNARVQNMGLNSIDVINHELFHAFLCLKHPEYCSGNERDDVHEALADVFAYRMNPDEYFGEGFYKNSAFIRAYQTNWRVGLVRTPHEKGLALASQIIQQNNLLASELVLFDRNPRIEVFDEITGLEASALNRYRLSLGQAIEIDFRFSSDLDGIQVSWPESSNIGFTRLGSTKFRLTNRRLSSTEKIRVLFLDKEKKEIGGWNYYFGPVLDQ